MLGWKANARTIRSQCIGKAEDGTRVYRDVCRTEVANFGVPFTDWPTWLPFRCQVVQAIARHALASITLDAAESSTEAREEGMYP